MILQDMKMQDMNIHYMKMQRQELPVVDSTQLINPIQSNFICDTTQVKQVHKHKVQQCEQ